MTEDSNARGSGEAVTLLPCPFCGGEASDAGHIRYSRPLEDAWWNDGSKITEAFYASCMKCGAVSRSGIASGYQTLAEAVAAWNTRATPQPAAPEGLVEALAASLAKRSVPTMDPTWTKAFNAALDMVARDTALAASPALATATMGEDQAERDHNGGFLLSEEDADPAIPAGMVAWHGGDSAPEDWDGGRVMFRIGDMSTKHPGEGLDWSHRPYSGQSALEIIAYTPTTKGSDQ